MLSALTARHAGLSAARARGNGNVAWLPATGRSRVRRAGRFEFVGRAGRWQAGAYGNAAFQVLEIVRIGDHPDLAGRGLTRCLGCITEIR